MGRLLQRLRVPIWVAGAWPNKRPFRRAARWDGVFPVRWEGEITPEMMREIVSYTLRHREGEEPFDVAFGGRTPGGDGDRGGLRRSRGYLVDRGRGYVAVPGVGALEGALHLARRGDRGSYPPGTARRLSPHR